MNTIILILLILSALIIHEFGHFIGYLVFKKFPSLKLKWWGVTIGDNIIYSLFPYQVIIITISGIVFGYVFVYYFLNQYLAIYFVCCAVDITNLINLYSIKKSQRKMTILEIAKENVRELEEKYG
jgi:hypothetical protein